MTTNKSSLVKNFKTTKEGRMKLMDSGYVLIPNATHFGVKEIIIREPLMRDYQTFYQHWQVAAGLFIESIPMDERPAVASPDFLTLKTTFHTTQSLFRSSELFRENCLEALRCVGIEEPLLLKPAQFEELLFRCQLEGEDEPGVGLIFRLVKDDPKILAAIDLSTQEKKAQTPTNRLQHILTCCFTKLSCFWAPLV